ncbi:glycosyltransferase [Alicyclobacillus fastidiosus]|uniref:Glycosyltransferase n=1 Tax=Alicyclobacillus fastidiosus TaxID=392011 RepID=A0ABY6ZLS3_9BACL|nr:glycosyltransferase family 2 protein [Alicyclobacillus fastidiosus]WAH43816.1 glycosyltransferase [Alicyclobacillus fastidiosus]
MYSSDKIISIRTSDIYTHAYEKTAPLITVCIATYNRANLLLTRSLRSVINQTYTNLQIIVIGDGCTDNTEDIVRSFDDPRIHFENLPQHGMYPTDPYQRWQVAGTIPLNRALELATGDFVTHLDDDDEFVPHRIERLVEYAISTKADFIFHPFYWECSPSQWTINDARSLEHSNVTTSSVFYHHWFKYVPWDLNAYLIGEPGDWNRFKKVKELGAKTVRCPDVLTLKFNFSR